MIHKNIYTFLVILVIGSIFFSCKEELTELDKGHDTLTLLASTQELELLELNYDNSFELTWSTGTNYGTGRQISYTLEIAEAGTNFENSFVEEMGTRVYAWERTVQELNTLLYNELGIEYNTSTTIEARIIATVLGYQEAENDKQVSKISIPVVTYQPVTTTLYIIGDATPTGWEADNEDAAMERVQPGVFTWTGKLSSSGEFKFITTAGEFIPSYNRDATAKDGLTLVYRSKESDPDETFSVSKDSTYIITANLLTLTLSLGETQEGAWRFDELYILGSLTGWDENGHLPLTPDPLQKNLFHFGYVMPAGEFKFGTQLGWQSVFTATEEDAPYTSTGMLYHPGYADPDNKWKLSSVEGDKPYKIAVSLTTGDEKMVMKEFTPFETIYLVGDASPTGWNIGRDENTTPMDKTGDYTFSWTGTLNEGELKICCDLDGGWDGAWFMPDAAGKEPTGDTEYMFFSDKTDNDLKALYPDVDINNTDLKWKISSSGTYTITVDQLKQTISFVKQ